MRKLARSIRSERDRRYWNRYDPNGIDTRWVGDLGEIALHHWLTSIGIAHTWHSDPSPGDPDFTIAGERVELKTSHRSGEMRGRYLIAVPPDHAGTYTGELFFACHEASKGTICLLGGMPVSDFIAQAVLYPHGSALHAHAIVKDPAGLLAMPALRLTPPRQWIRCLYTSTFAKPASL